MASPFLTALASIGSQYSEGRSQAAEEKVKRLAEQQQLAAGQARLGIEQSQQDLERQRLQFEQQKFKAQPDINWVEVDKNRKLPWSISKGKFVDPKEIPGYTQNTITGPLTSGASMLSMIKDPDVRNQTMARMSSLFESVGPYATPEQVEAIVKDGANYSDKLIEAKQKADEKKQDALEKREAARETARDKERAYQEHRQEMEAFQRSMVGFRAEEKNRYMSQTERTQYDTYLTITPLVDRLGKFLENNKLTDDNSFVFSDHSALVNHMRMMGYRYGVSPDAQTAEMLKDAAAIGTIGAATWTRMLGRSRYTYDDIRLHLPQPTDTPGNLYTKVNWFRDTVLLDVRGSLSGLIPPGQTQPLPPPNYELPGAAGDTTPALPAMPLPTQPVATDQPRTPQSASPARDPNNPLGLTPPH